MYLKDLTLFQFKNHAESNFTFNEKINCFVGNNGVGKTNILDAIHYLSFTKSYFNYMDSQNIQFNNDFFMIRGSFIKDENNDEIQCNFDNKAGKIIKINKKKYKKFSEHIGEYPVIIISPTDSNLILEGSEIRRKYLDSSISQYKKSYLQTLINYNKVLKQRNFLLKQFFERNYFDEITLERYDNEIIKYAEIIYEERKSFISKLSLVFNKYYSIISDGNEHVSLTYQSQLNEKNIDSLLKESINKDRLSQRTSTGIHKDDILFNMSEYQIKKIGSQGQQKTFLIALKLAQYDFISNKIGFKPIILLDDIFDKLDDLRVKQLMSFAKDGFFGQVFITDTHENRCKEILNSTEIDFNLININL
ncbi:MAG: DNA replication/repair protein RecF [Flavobacteriales bacterium]